MADRTNRSGLPLKAAGGLLFIIIISLLGVLTWYMVFGRGTKIRSLPRTMWNVSQAILHRDETERYASGDYRDIVFLHHSTGENLIEQGDVRQLFSEAGYMFWDQGDNHQGLRDPNGEFTGYGYSIPRDNTDPDGLVEIFNQPEYRLPLNALSGLLQHEVILIKSCFAPTSKIVNESQLRQYQNMYLAIREEIDRHPEKLFVLLTQPPLNPAETNPEEARRASELASWLASPDFLGGRKNLVVFDLFSHLAEEDPATNDHNMLRAAYRRGEDSHPNRLANEQVAPELVDFVIRSIESYRKGR